MAGHEGVGEAATIVLPKPPRLTHAAYFIKMASYAQGASLHIFPSCLAAY